MTPISLKVIMVRFELAVDEETVNFKNFYFTVFLYCFLYFFFFQLLLF